MESENIKVQSNENGILTIGIKNRIDTNNANEVERTINAILKENEHDNIILDLSELEYISSVGIRILMKLARNNPGFKIINTTNEVYDILEMTGITTVIPITRKMREYSAENLEKIGSGFNGVVYRIDDETIVKVILTANSMDVIQKERDLSQKAFLMGIPTAISFDVVKVDDNYGIVYELLNSESYQARIENNQNQIFELGRRFGQLGREIHSVNVDDDTFSSAKERLLNQLEGVKNKYSKDDYDFVKEVLEAIPEGNTFIHGDFHPGNVLIQDEEPLLIDMATASKGHPLQDLITFAVPTVGSVYTQPEDDFKSVYNGLTKAQNFELYDGFLSGYFNTEDKDYLEKLKKQIFPFMLAKKSMGLARYVPDIDQDSVGNNKFYNSEETDNSKVTDMGTQVLIAKLKECIDDMKEAFKNAELPLEF